jgi:uncharacterized YccA/Bax inhibitor family protein
MRTGNPALHVFQKPQSWDQLGSMGSTLGTSIGGSLARSTAMTVNGTIAKSAILLGICTASALGTWHFMGGVAVKPSVAMGISLSTMLLGTVLSLIISFAPRSAPVLAPIFAVVEGAFVSAASLFISIRFLGKFEPTLIAQGVIATLGIFGGLLIAYRAGLVRVGGTVAKIVGVLLAGLCVYSLALILGNLVFNLGIPNLFSSASPWGIGFTAICVLLASVTLVLDFQFIEQGEAEGAPKYMEWVGAFGLLSSLVWLYIEVLRLIAKLAAFTQDE